MNKVYNNNGEQGPVNSSNQQKRFLLNIYQLGAASLVKILERMTAFVPNVGDGRPGTLGDFVDLGINAANLMNDFQNDATLCDRLEKIKGNIKIDRCP